MDDFFILKIESKEGREKKLAPLSPFISQIRLG